ncbi:hypothetical protein h2es_0966 [Rickettsiales endosymbiont of Trichoplax sp. H2]|nr:hypothetical protein [Rickettsiales endosymbiont of Trichoplax sp. H2]
MAIDNKLNILSEDKVRELYGIPKLESEDREEKREERRGI